RVSADGQTFTAWHAGIIPEGYGLMHLIGRTARVIPGPDRHSFNGHWALPGADGGLVFRHGGGIYSGEMKGIAADPFKDAVLLPTEAPRFFLALRGQGKDRSAVSICTAADRRPVATVGDLEPMTRSVLYTNWGLVNGEPRVHYLPTANVLITLP